MYQYDSMMRRARAEIAEELTHLIGDEITLLKEEDLTETDLLLIDNFGAKLKIIYNGAENGELEDVDPDYIQAKLKAFDEILNNQRIPHIRRSDHKTEKHKRFNLFKMNS